MRRRPLDDDERRLATSVFGEAPWLDEVRLTNLPGFRRRAHTLPGPGRRIYCSLGERFDDPLAPSGAYPVRGQLLVHELTHAWQIAHASSRIGFVVSAAVLQARHEWGQPRGGFDAYSLVGVVDAEAVNIEQQATAVDRWFAGLGPHSHVVERVRRDS